MITNYPEIAGTNSEYCTEVTVYSIVCEPISSLVAFVDSKIILIGPVTGSSSSI